MDVTQQRKQLAAYLLVVVVAITAVATYDARERGQDKREIVTRIERTIEPRITQIESGRLTATDRAAVVRLVEQRLAAAGVGTQGADGARGTNGSDGSRGQKGLPGIAGSAGAAGIAGARGSIGPRGPQGERGPAGVPGIRGPQGVPGVPGEVNVDQIVAQVLAQLPQNQQPSVDQITAQVLARVCARLPVVCG